MCAHCQHCRQVPVVQLSACRPRQIEKPTGPHTMQLLCLATPEIFQSFFPFRVVWFHVVFQTSAHPFSNLIRLRCARQARRPSSRLQHPISAENGYVLAALSHVNTLMNCNLQQLTTHRIHSRPRIPWTRIRLTTLLLKQAQRPPGSKNSAGASKTSNAESKNSTRKLTICDATGKTTGLHVRIRRQQPVSPLTDETCILSVFPLIFHSINDEIPEASRPLITRLYQLWLVLVLTLILNMVACIFILLAGSSDGGRDLGASIG